MERVARRTHGQDWTSKDWNKRGDSIGETRMDKKFTFRIRKDAQTSNKEKIGRASQEMAVTQTGFYKGSFANGYVQEGTRERNLSAAVNTNTKHPFKDMNIADKISKQISNERTGQFKFSTTFYNGVTSKADQLSHDTADIKHNNFIKTGGFGGTHV